MNIFPLFFAAAKIGVGRGAFYFATTKIRVGRGPLLRLVGCGRDRCHSGGFYLGLCRLRGILSPPAPHDCAAGGLFYFAATKIGIGRRSFLRQG